MLSQISDIAPSHNPAIGGLAISPALFPPDASPAEPPKRVTKEAGLLNALTIIVHDLRGPLANLALMIELIETHAQMRALDQVTRSSRKAQDLIASLGAMLDGFLQRTRETGDPLSFTPTLLDVADVVREAVELNRPVAESREITFDCTGLEVGTISGDAALLREAVSNLVGNAVKYAPARSTVTCETAIRGREAIIRVRDEGQGLTEYDLKRAFNPFTTLSARYAGKGSSWGLGLWIVRLIAERHAGRVEVQSHGTWRGAQFSICLPTGG
jgi:signal transduction histidine kinase